MTKTREEYAAMIPDLAERENGARLLEAMLAAERAADEYVEQLSPAQEAAREELFGVYRAKSRDLHAWYDAEMRKLADGAVPLRSAADEAERAYNEAPGGAIEEDDGKALRCALSGAPIYEDDETVDLGGRAILACVLLSQEQIAALTADDETEEAA